MEASMLLVAEGWRKRGKKRGTGHYEANSRVK